MLEEKKKTIGKYELSIAEFVRLFVSNGEEVTISGKGTSMLPTIDEKCSLVMAPLRESGARAGDILLYTRPNGQSVIHRIWRVTAQGYDMLGDNQDLIERNVPKTAAVSYVKRIRYQDGCEKPGYKKIWRIRMRYAYRRCRQLAGRLYRKIIRKGKQSKI